MDRQSPFSDTIFALSSGALPSGVAIIRLSGPQTRDAIISLSGSLPSPRYASLRQLTNHQGAVLDHGLVLFFPAPASFTGEDCAELQVHGGRAVVSAILHELSLLSGLRPAEAGEFARRAFINGKIDLTGAEALADLISAETEAQRRLAFENIEGGQQTLYDSWRNRLVHARAMIEAEIDFSDEEDVPGSVADAIQEDLLSLGKDIDTHLDFYRTAEIVRDGFKVVLVGAPNAGKSSLLNALAKRDVAIVTEIAGTTRDLIEVSLDLNGQKVIVTDTAGLRQTEDIVEKIGVDRAIEAAEKADLILSLYEVGKSLSGGYQIPSTTPSFRVVTKIDLVPGFATDSYDHSISVVTGAGLEALIDAISKQAAAAAHYRSAIIPTRQRHVDLLTAAGKDISLAVEYSELELKAERLRLASISLGKITGAVDVEELLGVIFQQFCIGK